MDSHHPPVIAILCLLCAIILRAQSPTGEIRLEVRDPSGAPMQVPGKLVNPAAGADRAIQTDAQGKATLPNLPYGRYRLEISTPGFATHSETIDVRSPSPVARTVTMSLAQGPQSKVDVVATMPLPGVDLSKNEIAAPVQTATLDDIQKSGALDLSDFLNRHVNGVHINEMQGNPFQPDVNFRGYTASPLLGTPQGISVYLDGVRQNQPFGDVVSWDLIPQNAISTITLIPGSDPLFGLNTLGGALSIQTRDGASNPGTSGKLVYGSSGRKALQAEHGGRFSNGFDFFLAVNAFHESGWRFDSPSDVRQGFGRFGWHAGATDFGLTLAYAYNTLTGNGLQDARLLARNWTSVYTVPDTTGNRAPALNFIVRHSFNSAFTFSGNAYYRNIRTEGINGNLNTNSLDQSVYQPNATDQAVLKAAGFTGYPASGATAANTPFPFWRCIAQGLEATNPPDRCNAVTVFSKIVQNNYGFSGQITRFAASNLFTAGAALDRSNVDFTQNTQFGYLNPNGSITGIHSWADDSRVNLHGLIPNWSLFATDSLSLGKGWHVTLSGRYNRNTVENTDHITPGGGPGSLDAHDVFGRFNPSVGVTWSPTSTLNAYASYTQGSRAPTSIELGCADPLNPCNLPNALASDPPLKQVVTKTWEAGLRGTPEHHAGYSVNWSAGAFRAENTNDILFVSSPQTGSGFFKNFGKTRRQGIQADVDATIRRVTGGLDYTLLDATYQSAETVDGSGNSASDTALAGMPGLDGGIAIRAGNQIPLVPRHTGKVFANVQATSRSVFDFGLVATSSSYARGNENNLHKADGKYYLGSGISPGYAVVNFGAHYDLTKRFQLAVQVDNLLDRHYYTAAQLAVTGFTSQGTYIARPFPAYATGDFPLQRETFYAPGAPRRAWIELRVKL